MKGQRAVLFQKGTFTDNRYAFFGGTVKVCGCRRSSDIFGGST